MTEPSWYPESGPGETLEENWLFRLRKQRFRSRHSGKAHDYYVLDLPDAVNVVAITPAQQLVMVRQFRAGSGHDTLETPGGLLSPGEDPLQAGARELLEETGYAGDPPTLLGSAWANPSILSCRVATILITSARRVAEPNPDASEELSVELVDAAAVAELIRGEQIEHALVVMALLLWLAA